MKQTSTLRVRQRAKKLVLWTSTTCGSPSCSQPAQRPPSPEGRKGGEGAVCVWRRVSPLLDLLARSKGGVSSDASRGERCFAHEEDELTGYFDETGMFDITALDPRDYARDPDEQALRPDIFITKRGRPRSRETGRAYWCSNFLDARNSKSSLSYSDFKSAYNAVSFANAHHLLLDCMLTFHLEKLTLAVTGSRAPSELKGVLQRFLRHLNQWFRDRFLPNLYVGVTENGAVHGLHVHVLMFVPGYTPDMTEGRADPWIRGELRKWLREYALRNYRCEAKGVFDFSRSNRERTENQWRYFHYMMKGVDRTEVVVRGRHHQCGRDLTLGGLVAHRFLPSGPIPDELKACWTSRDLGKGAQERGHCGYGKHVIGKRVPDLTDLFGKSRPPLYQTDPYQSPLDAGIFDVRRLYGEEFARGVMRESFKPLKKASDSIR